MTVSAHPDWELLAERTFRIGVQRLWRHEGRYFLAIRNRTYASIVEIPIERARRHWLVLNGRPLPKEEA